MYKFLLDFIYAKKKDLNLTLEYIISLFFLNIFFVFFFFCFRIFLQHS